MTRIRFDKSLNDINIELLKMSAFTINALEDSFKALKNKDVQRAKIIIEHDHKANNMEISIEHKCLKIIATEQPLASDLRMLTVSIKIIADLERICDHAADISEIVLAISENDYQQYYELIVKYIDLAKSMVKDSIDSYTYKDLELAQSVILRDDIMDNGFKEIIESLEEELKNNIEKVGIITRFMFLAKYLERICDHATNIAEWAIFNETGEYL